MVERTSDIDLPALMARCRAGEQMAWEELVRELSGLVYSIPVRAGFAQDEVDDIVQSVFAILVRRIDSIEDPQALPKWFTVTTQRACWREIRSGRSRRSRERDHALHASDSDYEAVQKIAEAEYRAEVVRSAMQKIGRPCERLLRLLFGESRGKSPGYSGISEVLGMPVGSIGPTRARCLKRLSLAIAEEEDGQEVLDAFDSPLY